MLNIQLRPAPVVIAGVLAVATLAAPQVAFADSFWGSVGTTGSVDEECFANVRLTNYAARLTPGTTQATCTIRYQVNDTFGRANGLVDRVYLTSHLLDNGQYARVEVRLRSYNRLNGSSTILSQINSDSAGGSNLPNGYRHIFANDCHVLDFRRFHYWVEAVLMRTASPVTAVQGTPAIARVSLEDCLI